MKPDDNSNVDCPSVGLGYMPANGAPWIDFSPDYVNSGCWVKEVKIYQKITKEMVGASLIMYANFDFADGKNTTTITGYVSIGGIVQSAKTIGSKTSSKTPAKAAPVAPAVAAAAGVKKLVLNDDFDNISTIDINNTKAAGFNWYMDRPFAWGQTVPSDISINNSILTLKPTSWSPNYTIGSVSPSGKVGKSYQYGYFEAKIKFDPSKATLSDGWPSFWGVSAARIKGTVFPKSVELDFFEAMNHTGQAGQPFENAFAGTVHEWNIATNEDRANYGDNWKVQNGVNWNDWHVYGCLWTKGKMQWFMDGREINSFTYGPNIAPTPNSMNNPVGSFTQFDDDAEGQCIILGTGQNYPIDVDWVHIWQ